MLEKFFGRSKKRPEAPQPEIQFGRYSDNNKTTAKVARWTDADNYFKDKKIVESFDAFFDYLKDDGINNVVHERNQKEGRFELVQGSKIVRGNYNEERLVAEVMLARMPQPSVPVMRRLLEQNFGLYYSRYALDGDRLCMRFDSPTASSNPNKLYYGLKELATKADKQDDLLVQDFAVLEKHDTEHIIDLPDHEKEVKYQYLQKWIGDTLDYIGTLDADKLHGGIAYLLLTLAFRIDYLIVPEGKLMHDIEKIVDLYFKKDERPVPEKNRDLIEEFKKIQAKPKEEVVGSLYRSKHTFSIVAPQNHKAIADAIYNANQNMAWYRDNNYPLIAEKIIEYGIAYCQFSYSMPRAVTELFEVFMRVNYSDYFEALGFPQRYYTKAEGKYFPDPIHEDTQAIAARWRDKYPNLSFRSENIKYGSMMDFNQSFTSEIEFMNFENK